MSSLHESIRGLVQSPVLLPLDAGYDEARATFNATTDRHPAVIVQPHTTAEVAAAVRWARANHLPVAVRGGGHSVAGHAVGDGALVVDLRRMRGVSVDASARRARVGGGALWEDVDTATTAHGLAMPGGTFIDTGVGGLTLGGGIGYLLGTAGLTCDNLMRAEVVTADGAIVTAGEGGDPELLWALRGGGGNFGVVTEFEFRLSPVGTFQAGSLDVALPAAGEALRLLAALAHDCPPELTIYAGGPSFRTDEELAPGASPAPHLSVGLAYQGPAEALEQLIRPLRALPIVGDSLTPMSYLDLQRMNAMLPFGLRHYWKGHFVRDLDAATISAITTAMDAAQGTSFVLIEALTGKGRQEPEGGAAFGQRAARWNVTGVGIWEDSAQDALHIGWARDLAQGVKGSSLSGAGYANYSSADETAERVRASFGDERFQRLTAVKRRYDPDNVFRFNLNIPPARG